MRKAPLSSLVLSLAAALAAIVATPVAHAFTLADGTSITCTARGVSVREYEAPAGDPVMRDRTGMTVPENNGYAIVWNAAKLKALPPVVHDFIFFHECAHARIPTTVELQANCGGLKDMRAAGRAGDTVEDKLAAYFGAGNVYWAGTVKCANQPLAPANPPGTILLPPAG
jgi:hypothetical protein